MAHLVQLVAASSDALWAMDFPFGLPVEVLDDGMRWPGQLQFLREWGDDAYGVGLECVARANRLGGPMHIRRLTDHEARAPFDCYHYRIIYQTFYGMRDVLTPLVSTRGRRSCHSNIAGCRRHGGCSSRRVPARRSIAS